MRVLLRLHGDRAAGCSVTLLAKAWQVVHAPSRFCFSETTPMPKPYGRSAEAAQYRRLYHTARWQRMRAVQLAAEPLCRFCLAIEDVTEATDCDHIKPHKGDETLFFDPNNLQSLCAPCHRTLKARIERGQQAVVIGVDGYPIEVG